MCLACLGSSKETDVSGAERVREGSEWRAARSWREQTTQEHVGPSSVHCRAGGQPGADYEQGSDDTV